VVNKYQSKVNHVESCVVNGGLVALNVFGTRGYLSFGRLAEGSVVNGDENLRRLTLLLNCMELLLVLDTRPVLLK